MIMAAGTMQVRSPDSSTTIATPMLRLRGVATHIDGRAILSGIDLELGYGRTVALVGNNGAGKSTLLKLIARLLPLSAGEMDLLGARFSGRSLTTPATVRSRIGVIGHGLMLYRDLTVLENLRLFGKLYGAKNIAAQAETMLTRFGLRDVADRCVKSLSRGMAQRVAIARAVIHEPQLLLADEPFTGLDGPGAASVAAAIEMVRSGGGTVVLADHDLNRCLRTCDEVVALRAGRLALRSPTAGLGDIRLARVMQEGPA
jgi:heme exporter protein A